MTASGPGPRQDLARYSTIGLEFAAIVGVLGWLGNGLDGMLFGPDGFPVFLLLGLLVGLVGGILRLQQQLGPGRDRRERSDRPDRDHPE